MTNKTRRRPNGT